MSPIADPCRPKGKGRRVEETVQSGPSKTKKYDVIVNGSSEEEFEGDGEAEVEG